MSSNWGGRAGWIKNTKARDKKARRITRVLVLCWIQLAFELKKAHVRARGNIWAGKRKDRKEGDKTALAAGRRSRSAWTKGAPNPPLMRREGAYHSRICGPDLRVPTAPCYPHAGCWFCQTRAITKRRELYMARYGPFPDFHFCQMRHPRSRRTPCLVLFRLPLGFQLPLPRLPLGVGLCGVLASLSYPCNNSLSQRSARVLPALSDMVGAFACCCARQ